ncbi:MAG: hypothetical protein JWN48_1665 [Myxococcaceae bacterium]|nr:hypothetical protein [Myxococcaceae bacterium]
MRQWAWAIGAAVGLLALGCSDDSGGPSSGSSPADKDSGTGTRADGAISSGNKSDAGSSGAMCMGNTTQPGDYGACTSAEAKVFTDCVDTACSSQYKTCYGADYKQGKFGGACKDYLTCASACPDCDATCVQKCKPSSECTSCLSSFSSCSSSCIDNLDCATGGLGGDAGLGGLLADSGIDLSKDCDDLAACCKTLSGDQKTACDMVQKQYASAGSSGAIACSAAIGTLCR